MIKGKFWPIPQDRILDGSIISLKNAYRLTKDAEILLKEKKYSTALTIATLALEEFGKHCMLNDDELSAKRDIDTKIWHGEYESHVKKIVAIPKYLRKFSKKGNSESQQKLVEMEKYFNELSTRKLKSLYVDWDGQNNDWYYYDDNSPEKEDEARKAVESAIWSIEKYLEDVGGDIDLVMTTPKQLIKLLQENKVHCFCPKCASAILNHKEYLGHNKKCSMVPSWYWNS